MASIPQGEGVYLIHFEQPLKHAQHYIGWSRNISQRAVMHRTGRGSRLVQIVTEQGIGWVIARTWMGKSRRFERELKNRKKARVLCPICNPFSAERYPVARKGGNIASIECPF